jgi:hypothetical protein
VTWLTELLASHIGAALWTVAVLVILGSILVLIPKIEHDRIRTVANIVSAGAAVTIPIVVYQGLERARTTEFNTAKDTKTHEMMIKLDHRLSDLVDQKARLDRWLSANDESRFTSEYINKNPRVRTVVWGILNEYEAVCVGVNQDLLSLSIVWSLRGDSLIRTFDQYRSYIDERRKEKPGVTDTAWTDCTDLADMLKNIRQELNAKADLVKKDRLGRLLKVGG